MSFKLNNEPVSEEKFLEVMENVNNSKVEEYSPQMQQIIKRVTVKLIYQDDECVMSLGEYLSEKAVDAYVFSARKNACALQKFSKLKSVITDCKKQIIKKIKTKRTENYRQIEANLVD